MISLLFIIALSCGYYYYHTKYPREDKEIIYFSIFVGCYLLFIYLLHYERDFIYKILVSLYETHKQPLYPVSDTLQVRSYDTKYRRSMKSQILENQGSRCAQCKSFILMKDEDKYHVSYKHSLYHGGQTNMDNIEVICEACNDFKRN